MEYLDRDHVPFDLADLALARLYALGELLQLRADLAEGDSGLQLAVTPLQLVQLGTQVHTHNADLFLQTAHTHIPSRESRWLARENKSTLSSTLTHQTRSRLAICLSPLPQKSPTTSARKLPSLQQRTLTRLSGISALSLY